MIVVSGAPFPIRAGHFARQGWLVANEQVSSAARVPVMRICWSDKVICSPTARHWNGGSSGPRRRVWRAVTDRFRLRRFAGGHAGRRCARSLAAVGRRGAARRTRRGICTHRTRARRCRSVWPPCGAHQPTAGRSRPSFGSAAAVPDPGSRIMRWRPRPPFTARRGAARRRRRSS